MILPERLSLLTGESCHHCAGPLRALRRVVGERDGKPVVSAPTTVCPTCDMVGDPHSG